VGGVCTGFELGEAGLRRRVTGFFVGATFLITGLLAGTPFLIALGFLMGRATGFFVCTICLGLRMGCFGAGLVGDLRAAVCLASGFLSAAGCLTGVFWTVAPFAIKT
jgi:hypothetical protein